MTEHNDSSIAAASNVESNSQQLSQALELRNQQSPVPIVGTLSAAQTQYLNQLTQQTSENMKYSNSNVQGYGVGQTQIFEKTNSPVYSNSASNVSQQYNANTQQYSNSPSSTYANSGYGVNSTNYGVAPEQSVHQPVRTKTQRARVPPPSKVFNKKSIYYDFNYFYV